MSSLMMHQVKHTTPVQNDMAESVLFRRLPWDVARGELGPMLNSKDLAQLCALDKERGLRRLQFLGRAQSGAHVADSLLDDTALTAFAEAGVWVTPVSGIIHVPVAAKDLKRYHHRGRRWLMRYRRASSILHPYPSKLLPWEEAGAMATCSVLHGCLHGESMYLPCAQPAWQVDVGSGIGSDGQLFILQRCEFWCHGKKMMVSYRWTNNARA